jgi:hypothetical protein
MLLLSRLGDLNEHHPKRKRHTFIDPGTKLISPKKLHAGLQMF